MRKNQTKAQKPNKLRSFISLMSQKALFISSLGMISPALAQNSDHFSQMQTPLQPIYPTSQILAIKVTPVSSSEIVTPSQEQSRLSISVQPTQPAQSAQPNSATQQTQHSQQDAQTDIQTDTQTDTHTAQQTSTSHFTSSTTLTQEAPSSTYTPVTNPPQQAFQHTVKSGETLWDISSLYNIPQDRIAALNALSSEHLQVGQVLYLRDVITHKIDPKETLSSLHRTYGVSTREIAAYNGLSVDSTLHIGQVVQIPVSITIPTTEPTETTTPVMATIPQPAPVTPVVTPSISRPVTSPNTSTTSTSTSTSTANTDQNTTAEFSFTSQIRRQAMTFLNVPYKYGHQSRRSTDCSGFVLQVFASLGVKLPRNSAAQAGVGQRISLDNLQVGDLVFFDTVGKGRVSHVGIYVGNNKFINANSYKSKVAIDTLRDNSYWMPRYRGARRISESYIARK